MRIKVVTVGSKMPSWVQQGCQEYDKRLPSEMTPTWVELPLGHRGKSASVKKAIEQEGKQMSAALSPDDVVVALDVLGKAWSTEQLAQNLGDWRDEARNVSFIIGGPDGLAQECLQRADRKWSLSALTLPHPLVRVVLTEQIYRAWSILSNHPYHR